MTRRWHKSSVFGDGPRVPMCRERRAVWRARIEIHRRAGRITDGESYVAAALLKRLGQDGRCDPSHATLAADSGESVSTVKRALAAFHDCGLVSWVRRLARDGWRAVQISNAYRLTLGEPAKTPASRCEVQTGRVTLQEEIIPCVAPASAIAVARAQAALAIRRSVVEAKLLGKGSG
jgi:hypothetical protein